jgi:chromate transporter
VKELALLFLRLGATAFGGPAAHIALMEDEVVRKRAWLTRAEFMDLLGMSQLIPGPNSTELAIHIGHRRAGWPGLLVAGACFILPAFVMVLALAAAYVHWGYLPAASGFLSGLRPALLAIVASVTWKLGRSTLTQARLQVLAAACLIGALLGAPEVALLIGSGLLLALLTGLGARSSLRAVEPISLTLIFLVFLKIGSVLFGSGYVLLTLLRADLVENWGWLRHTTLLDAFAIGQITPGPVFTTATFIGYLLHDVNGAILATVGIFLPAFVFVALSAPLLPRLRGRASTAAFLDGVNAASIGLLAAVLWQLAQGLRGDPQALIAGAVACGLLIGPLKKYPTWLLLGCGLLGYLRNAWQSGMN